MSATPTPAAGQPRLIEAYKDLAERNPKDRYVLHWLLMAYLSQKAFTEGIQQFMRFVAQDDHNDQAHMCLGVLYEKGGYGDESIRSYLKVLALNPNEELVYLFLSTRYILKGEWAHALTVTTSGIEKFPRAERLHFNRGFALAQQQEFDKAIEAFTKEIEISPQCSEAYFNIDVIKRNKVSALKMKK